MSNNKNTPVILLGAVAAVAAASLLYYALAVHKQESASAKPSKPDDDDEDDAKPSATSSRSVDTSDSSRTTPTKAVPAVDTDQTPLVKNGGKSKQLHARIEELDKQGKGFFKAKQVRMVVEASSGSAEARRQCRLIAQLGRFMTARLAFLLFLFLSLSPPLTRLCIASSTYLVYGSGAVLYRGFGFDCRPVGIGRSGASGLDAPQQSISHVRKGESARAGAGGL